MIKSFFLAVILAISLSGCITFGSKYNQLDVKEVQVKEQHVPEEMLTPCIPNKPPAKEEYLALKPHERESALTEYTVSLLGTVKECNGKLQKIKDLQTKPTPAK